VTSTESTGIGLVSRPSRWRTTTTTHTYDAEVATVVRSVEKRDDNGGGDISREAEKRAIT